MQGFPTAFASELPEEFRDGVYAQGTSHGLQQSGAAGCCGGGETTEVIEINGTVLDQWHMSNSHPKTGQQELLPSPDCELSPGTLWSVTVFAIVRNLRTNAWLVRSGNLAILVSIALLLLGHPRCSHTAAWPWEIWFQGSTH